LAAQKLHHSPPGPIEEGQTTSTEKNMNKVKATKAQITLALIVLGTVVAKDALAAEPGISGVSPGAGLQSNHTGGFDRPLDRGPAMPPPVFNQSNPYTVPQSPERPVSPASSGSVFGNH
jgi:hypothetical protein